MEALTPAERRGALVVVLLLVLGATHDLWRASRPVAAPSGQTVASGREAGSMAPEVRAADPADAAPAGTPAGSLAIDLNRATARELDGLPGVGPVLAGRIIDHRRLHGPFRAPEELLAVRGIGPRLFARLRPRIRVDSTPAPGSPARPDTAPPR